ncbi:MAG: hypothetical protein N2C14_21945, partial [Planctomycetales bacterium]
RYYNQVVDGVQRDAIYKIQARYAAQIDALDKQIAALKKQRDEEVALVLRPEQVERLRQLQTKPKPASK